MTAPPESLRVGRRRGPAGETSRELRTTRSRALPRETVLALAGIGALVGIALRIWALSGYISTLDSDEAVVGLMGRHFLHGEHTVFFWGQSHGGSVEAIIAAAIFAVVGSSSLALKAVPLLLDSVAAVLVWRIGIRVLDRRLALAAAVLFWIWPATYVFWSTKERGFYYACLVLGLVVLLCTLRLVEKPDRWVDWAVLGLAAGLGWWTSPQIMYYVIPAAAWLLFRVPLALWRAPVSLLTAFLGAWPWTRYNLDHHWESLVVPPGLVHGTYWDHLVTFFTQALPMAVGTMTPYSYRWVVPSVGPLLYLGVLVILGFAFRRPAGMGLVLLFAAAYPFIHAISPLSQFVDEARYLVYLSPALALLGIAALRRGPAIGAAMAGALALTVIALGVLAEPPRASGGSVPIPASMTSLVRDLEQRGVHHAFGIYWIAYRLTFESREQVVAASTDTVRYPPFQDQVRSAGDVPAWVFAAGSADGDDFERRLRKKGVTYDRRDVGGFRVFLPASRILPEDLPG